MMFNNLFNAMGNETNVTQACYVPDAVLDIY